MNGDVAQWVVAGLSIGHSSILSRAAASGRNIAISGQSVPILMVRKILRSSQPMMPWIG
jgi:hypothetical protein